MFLLSFTIVVDFPYKVNSSSQVGFKDWRIILVLNDFFSFKSVESPVVMPTRQKGSLNPEKSLAARFLPEMTELWIVNCGIAIKINNLKNSKLEIRN